MPAIKLYNRAKAVEYAHQWAFKRNPAYLDFENLSGDCTNFASQCLYAGGGVMNYTPVFGWYYVNGYKKSPSWTGVPYLYNFLTTNKTQGPFAKQVDPSEILLGDLVQLSFNNNVYRHTLVVVKTGEPPYTESILVAAHTNDSDYRAISTYAYESIRFLHIEGIYV